MSIAGCAGGASGDTSMCGITAGGCVDRMCWRGCAMCPRCVSWASGQYRAAKSYVRPGQVEYAPRLIAASHVDLTGYPAVAWRYATSAGVLGRSYDRAIFVVVAEVCDRDSFVVIAEGCGSGRVDSDCFVGSVCIGAGCSRVEFTGGVDCDCCVRIVLTLALMLSSSGSMMVAGAGAMLTRQSRAPCCSRAPCSICCPVLS